MCGRFTLRLPVDWLVEFLQGMPLSDYVPRFNIAPTQPVLCLKAGIGEQSSDRTASHPISGPLNRPVWEGSYFRWGLIPSWSSDAKIGSPLINARAETAAEKPAFRASFRRRRCLILADGFYEWKSIQGKKQPYYISATDPNDPLLCFAGLWESWRPKENQELIEADSTTSTNLDQQPNQRKELKGAEIYSCTILTTSANQTMQPLHDRMPVILDSAARDIWLNPQIEDRQVLQPFLRPAPDNLLQIYPVSPQVNRYNFDQPQCIERID